MNEATDQKTGNPPERVAEPKSKKIEFKQVQEYRDPPNRPQGELNELAAKVDTGPVSDFAWLMRFVRLREMGKRTVATATSVDQERKKVTLRYVGVIGKKEAGTEEDTVTVEVNTNDTAFRGYDIVLGEQNYVELANRQRYRTFEQIEEGQVVLFEPVYAPRSENRLVSMTMWQDAELLSFPEGVDPLNPF